MTKPEIMKLIKANGSKGTDIAKALREYFAQGIADGRVKPLTYYHAGDLQKDISGKTIVEEAQQIFTL